MIGFDFTLYSKKKRIAKFSAADKIHNADHWGKEKNVF